MDETNTKQNAKRVSTFDFCTLYTKLPHKDLIKVIFGLIDFGFNRGSKKKIDFSLKNAFWSDKPKTKSFTVKTSLKRTVQFLIENSCFTVGHVLLIRTVGIPITIDPVPFWANHESKYIINLIRTIKLQR